MIFPYVFHKNASPNAARLKRRCLRRALSSLLLLCCVLGVALAYSALHRAAPVFLFFPFSTPAPTPAPTPTPTPAALVVLDAGHGGFDGGCVGRAGTVEAPLDLAVAQYTAARLREAGLRVYMTRSTDAALGATKQEDFAARRKILNHPEAALCVSIHMNAFGDRAVSGPMAFYMQGSAEGERLATLILQSVCEKVGRPRRAANPGDYFVIRECACPAALIECGFLSNAAEEALLADAGYQALLAEGIAAGVLAYLAVPQAGTQTPAPSS